MLEAWTLRHAAVKADEDQLRESLRALSDDQRAAYFREYNHRLKDPDTYAVLNWFFLAGLHHMYLGRYLRGVFNLLVMAAGLTLLAFQPVIGGLMIAAVLVIELPALFRSQVIVEDYNVKLGQEILARF